MKGWITESMGCDRSVNVWSMYTFSSMCHVSVEIWHVVTSSTWTHSLSLMQFHHYLVSPLSLQNRFVALLRSTTTRRKSWPLDQTDLFKICIPTHITILTTIVSHSLHPGCLDQLHGYSNKWLHVPQYPPRIPSICISVVQWTCVLDDIMLSLTYIKWSFWFYLIASLLLNWSLISPASPSKSSPWQLWQSK